MGLSEHCIDGKEPAEGVTNQRTAKNPHAVRKLRFDTLTKFTGDEIQKTPCSAALQRSRRIQTALPICR